MKNDLKTNDWMKQNYLDRASEDISLGQKMSEAVYGRYIKHVMLLHIGAFGAVMLPQLLDLLQQSGFKLITLEEAETDPAYAIVPQVASKGGGTMLQMMMEAKQLPQIEHTNDPLDKLDAFVPMTCVPLLSPVRGLRGGSVLE